MIKRSVTLILACLVLCAFALPALAHDADIVTSFTGVGQTVAKQFEHEDDDPWKGFVNVWVTNSSQAPWGDFHFQIFSYQPGVSVENVHFIVDAPFQPISSKTLSGWDVDNAPVTGSTLDLYFYGDPVLPGQTATFTVYTDNTTDKVNFGLMMWPTPVPEPSSLIALSGGLMGLAGFALRRRR